MFEQDDLQSMWNARCAGDGVPTCAWCRAPQLALATLVASYRWCCVACGATSPWFSVKRGVVSVKRVVVVEARPTARLLDAAARDDGS